MVDELSGNPRELKHMWKIYYTDGTYLVIDDICQMLEDPADWSDVKSVERIGK